MTISPSPRHAVVYCPSGSTFAQSVAEALFAATAAWHDITVIQGDFVLPAADERKGAGITLIDLGGLRRAADGDVPWLDNLTARMEHACSAGGEIVVLIASSAETRGGAGPGCIDAPLRRFVREAASRFPGLTVEALPVAAALSPVEVSQRLISALADPPSR